MKAVLVRDPPRPQKIIVGGGLKIPYSDKEAPKRAKKIEDKKGHQLDKPDKICWGGGGG